MELNGPGTSLFQGNELSDFDNFAQREEEEEALEEQIRRDLELKSILENAFDDVSFENDEESVCNGSSNHSNNNQSMYNNSGNEFDVNSVGKIACNGNLSDSEKNSLVKVTKNNSPIKHLKNSLNKRFDIDSENHKMSIDHRKKMQNGNLHDVIDASGGGKASSAIQPSHFNHCLQKSALNEISNGISIEEEACDSSEQLKILYDVRVREVHRLAEMIDLIKKEHELAISKLNQQLAISQAEIERANISQTHLQNLLITNKQELDKMENKIEALESENMNLNSCKNELLTQIDSNNLVINTLERKVLVLEKGNRDCSEAVQYETNLKAIIEKHNFELMNLNVEQEKLAKQNEELSKENSELLLKLNRLSQVNDETIASKCKIINRLSKQIDETQRQCESLIKSSAAEDVLRLQMELKLLKEEKLSLTTKVDALEKENCRLEEELKQYESLSKISSIGSIGESNAFESSEINVKLSEELYRSLNGQKAKRLEIKKLQGEILEKNQKIDLLTGNEKINKYEISKLQKNIKEYVDEIKNYKDLISTKETEIKNLQAHIENLVEKCEATEKELVDLKKEIDLLKNNSVSSNKEKASMTVSNSEEYLKFHNDSLQRMKEETEKYYKLEILKKDLENENLKREIEEIKNMYVDVFSSKEALLKQLEKEKSYSGRNSVVDVDEVKKLQKELDKSRQRILELDQTLKQQYEQEVEILNLDIKQLTLQLEKLKREKDLEISEKDKMFVENELLKTEIEQVTSEKNLLLLDFEKLKSDLEGIHRNRKINEEGNRYELKHLNEKHEEDVKNLTEKYELIIRKLKKEIEFMVAKTVKCESKLTSPLKVGSRNAESQCSPSSLDRKSISPKATVCTNDMCTSPVSIFKGSSKGERGTVVRHIGIGTEPEAKKLSRKEVVQIMEKLGEHHESEMRSLENRYRAELGKLNKKFQVEVDKAKEMIKAELQKEHVAEIERLNEKHKIELENRIEEEKKEMVADLITEWAYEVQSLKTSYAEAQTEMERMKMKYNAAKSVALQYKTYFKSKTEHMKEEWKRIEDGYEQALRELEKNVHILVDVKEDEVKSKVDSITKIYEQKINKMKEKLSKCEDRLKEKEKKQSEELRINRDLERLQLPNVNLCLSPLQLKGRTREKGREKEKGGERN